MVIKFIHPDKRIYLQPNLPKLLADNLLHTLQTQPSR